MSRIITTLGSEHSISILRKAAKKPVSALELISELQIPRTTVYRCIRDLMDAGLLVKIRSQRTPNGHWFDEYRSLVNELRLYIKESEVIIELVSAEDMSNRLLKLWRLMERK